jgi:hypothetical protein
LKKQKNRSHTAWVSGSVMSAKEATAEAVIEGKDARGFPAVGRLPQNEVIPMTSRQSCHHNEVDHIVTEVLQRLDLGYTAHS